MKKLTLLHSNDLHGDFMSVQTDNKLLGGISMLSGYVAKTRTEEKNVIYAVAGDMLRGSVIDSEFKGLSTIEIMNMLSPDVSCVGNHEFDYGVAHLLFIEKCARFPVLSANLYVKGTKIHMFRSHYIKKIGGMKILFIGISTPDILKMNHEGEPVSRYVDASDAVNEIKNLCNRYKNTDIDLTVLLTHIGFEEDKKLAAMIPQDLGVDLIIGGHSHTLLNEPYTVNGIPIVQAVTGTDQIGRFDIIIDEENNKIDSYKWQLIPISEENCPHDEDLEKLIQKYKTVTDKKYSRYITRLEREIFNSDRNRENDIGKLFSDAIREYFSLDIMLIASGSLRAESFGPIVEYGDLAEMFPFGDEVYCFYITGTQLKQAIFHIFRREAFDGVHTEYYQFSKGIEITVSEKEKTVTSILFDGEPINEDAVFSVGLQGFHYKNIEKCLGLSRDDITKIKNPRILAVKDSDIIDEYLSGKELVKIPKDQRWITK